VPEVGDEEQQLDKSRERADRTEAIATLAAFLWVSASAIVFAVYGGNISLVGFLAIGPFIAAAFARPSRVLLVGLLATFFALIISTPPHSYGELNHTLRVVTQLAATAVAMWISHVRTQRDIQLWTSRSETRAERRRRVAAETAQRMQTMARALTTAADPSQVADAVFAALRDELGVDAATFAVHNERGTLRTLRRFGYDPDEPLDRVLSGLEPEGPIPVRTEAIFVEALEELRRQPPEAVANLSCNRFRSFAVVPMVVSDRAIGVLLAHWVEERTISKGDRNFLDTIAGTAAQAVERARLTLTEFVSLERSQHLHQLSSALAAATTPRDVADAAIAGCRRALGAQSAVVRVPAPGEHALTCLASSGNPALLSHVIVPVEGTASGASYTLGRTVVSRVGDGDDVVAELVAAVLSDIADPVMVVSEPLVGSVGPLGVLTLAFVARPDLGEPERRFLSTLAGHTAQALERAQLFEHERQALRDAEASRDRLSLLSEVTRLLSSSLEPTTVIRRTMSLVEGRLSDACVVHVASDAGLVRLDVQAGLLSSKGSESDWDVPVPFDSDASAAAAFRTGRTQLAPIPEADFGVRTDPRAPTDTDTDGDDDETVSTALSVPLTANGEVIGVMTFIDRPGRVFEVDDVALATEVASRTGVALSNATRFQREHVVAEVLQRAVLPDSLPEVAGLRLDAEYRAGVAGAYVGGDWYDVFQLGPGRVFFSVGDVMGKGAPAAALMGQVRSAIRAYAVAGQSPTEVLSSLDRLFDSLVEDRVVTAVVGTIDPSTGRVVLSNAGHPPPLVLRSDGQAVFCPTQRTLLIAAGLSGAPRPRDEFVLEPGDALVMYSDGLVERRGEPITAGMERLAMTASVMANDGWPERPAAAFASMLGTSMSGDEEPRTDDVVVLCLSYAGGADTRIATPSLGTTHDGMSTLHLEPVVESTPVARHWIAAHLHDLPLEVVECAGLLASELVTNAVLHAETPLCVTLHILPGRIRVDVADGSTALPSFKDYGREAATGRGLTLFDTLASNWGVQLVDGGKIVWFELPVDFPAMPLSISDGSFRFDLAGIAHADLHRDAALSPNVTIRLLGIPVALLQKSSEEYEGLFRELRLMKERPDEDGAAALPDRLSVLVSEIGTRFNRLGPGMDEIWQDALDQDNTSFDWELELPQSAVVACEFYNAMLDEADDFGLSAHLLTMPASPTSVAVRRWFLSELIGQLHGKAPVSWTHSHFHTELQTGAQTG
jgi:GAF domain-containing protein/anti-sigma regulatory factor (Ser/Thr protein kinase)